MADSPQNISRVDFVSCVDHVIRSRVTAKVLPSADDTLETRPHPLDDSQAAGEFAKLVSQAIEVAGWAPFHHSRKSVGVFGQETVHEPWRFYRLDRPACLALNGKIESVVPPEIKRGKVPGYLQICGTMILVTWLPEPDEGNDPKLKLRNDEHLAATSAAVQNLLLATESRGLATYWSSGGLLRDESVFQLLGIPTEEQLIGAVFLAPNLAELGENVQVNPGKLRPLRSPPSQWCKTIELAE